MAKPVLESIPRSPFHERIEGFQQGDANLILELPHSWVTLGEEQLHRGYCVLIFKEYVTEFHQIPQPVRGEFMNEIVLVGEAVQNATGAAKLNIEMLGNIVNHLHVHVFPRYDLEDPDMRRKPVWLYAPESRRGSLTNLEKMQLTSAIRGELINSMGRAGLLKLG